jgi:hypothetical protein
MVHWRKDGRRGRKILQIRASDKLFGEKGQEPGPAKFVTTKRIVDDLLLYDYGYRIHSKASCVGRHSLKVWATTENGELLEATRAIYRARVITRLLSSRFTNPQAPEKVTGCHIAEPAPMAFQNPRCYQQVVYTYCRGPSLRICSSHALQSLSESMF